MEPRIKNLDFLEISQTEPNDTIAEIYTTTSIEWGLYRIHEMLRFHQLWIRRYFLRFRQACRNFATEEYVRWYGMNERSKAKFITAHRSMTNCKKEKGAPWRQVLGRPENSIWRWNFYQKNRTKRRARFTSRARRASDFLLKVIYKWDLGKTTEEGDP